ncbi:MAG: CarD family transcriptional regulator [Pseudomonadota bacterium]|nr:CarD family transcriptional regulator [Pseudomonadota bacterium]
MTVKKKSKPKTKKTKTKKTTSKIKKSTVTKKAVKKVSASKKSKPKSKSRKPSQTKKITKPKAKIARKKTAKPKKVQLDYSIGDHIVYPSHGVGEVTSIQKYEIAEEKLEMYNVIFEKEKMTLKIPTKKAKEIGIRKVSSKANLKKTLEILNGKAKIRRTMWSRRAQEYESKINSGNLNELTEVVRDLFRNSSQPEQSYSERQLYESARDRLAREVAVVEKTDDEKAVEKIEVILNEATKKSSSENISL